MALIMKYIDSMHRYMESYGDPRTKDWPFMSSPFPTLAVCLSYVYIVKVLGPRLMENRKPFHLQNTLIVYNLSQVIFSAWLFYECLMGGWWGQYSFRCEPVDHSNSPTAMRIALSGWLTGHYNFRCQPVDYSNHPKTLRMVHACWWYYFSKFTEFMDTLFFVLRKKTSQVSTLHVIHHGCMPMSVWFGVKFTPGGHSTFFGLLNTFVHIVMYTYYLFAAMGPRYQKFLWWKKYLTALQMVQFVAIMVHAFQLLFIDCNYPRAFVWWIGLHAVMFFFLFNEFYKSAYRNDKAKLIAARNMLKCLLGMPYKSRSASNLKQALPASKANGHCNGTTAPLINGKISSNDTKDTQYQNGTTANGHAAEHYSSTEESRTITSTATKAADYYVRGELPTEITQRKIQK